jgi:GrpE protein
VDLLPALEAVGQEVARLRKTLLKLGHAQELFQQKIEEEIGRLSRPADRSAGDRDPAGAAGALPNTAQQRALMEVDQAVLHLLDLTRGADRESPAEAPEITPRSMREGLVLLQIRVRNLQRSFGLEPIPAVGRRFDDRLHQVYGVCDLPGLAEGEVAEEVLPGYRLGDRVVRPALVVVNRRKEPGAPAGERRP